MVVDLGVIAADLARAGQVPEVVEGGEVVV
jgi:hypothetical protein